MMTGQDDGPANPIDVAWEHCEWARSVGLTPQDVVAGCGAEPDPSQTWEFVQRLVAALFEITGRMPVAKKAQIATAKTRTPKDPLDMWGLYRPPPKPKIRERTCMANDCDITFLSEGPHNRLCSFHRRQDSLPDGWEHAEPLGAVWKQTERT